MLGKTWEIINAWNIFQMFFQDVGEKIDTLTTQFLSTRRLGDFKSRCTIIGVQLCK